MQDWLPLFIVYFAVMDPLGIMPIFLSLTDGFKPAQKYQIALRGCIVAFFVLLFFGVFGEIILSYLGVSPAAFNIAGGTLLFLIAVEMVMNKRQVRKRKSVEEEVKADIESLAASPLGVPLLAGPGAITSVMVFGSFQSVDDIVLNASAILAVLTLTGLMLAATAWAARFVNLTIMTVMSRIVGILLAAIAVQTVLEGLSYFGVTTLAG